LPLEIVDGKLVGRSPMDLSLQYSQDDLSILSVFIPYYKDSAGKLRLNLKALGVFPEVDLNGQVTIREGILELEVLKTPVTMLKADLELAGNKLLVDEFRGEMGEGRFLINPGSNIMFSGFMPAEYHLTLNCDNLGIDLPGYFRGKINGNINLETTNSKHVLYGKLVPSSATVFIPNRLLKKSPEMSAFIMPAFLKDFLFNIELDLEKQVWLQFSGSNIMTIGSLTLGGTPDNLGLAGEVKLLRGVFNLPFFERPFSLYRGTAYFYKGNGFLPYLDSVEGETRVSGVDIYISFTGYLDKGSNGYNLDMFSNPPYTRDQIMSLLVTGVAGNVMEPFNNSMNNQAMPSVLNIVQTTLAPSLTQSLGRALLLSELSVTQSSVSGAWNFFVSKALDYYERFLLTYAQYITTSGDRS